MCLLVALSVLLHIGSAKATSSKSRDSEAEADAQARSIASGRISKKRGRDGGKSKGWERERGLGGRRGANLGEAGWREVESKTGGRSRLMHSSAGKGK